MDLGTINRAGITQREFAELAGMSRVTVNRWVMGEREPQPANRKAAEDTLSKLNDLIEDGKLPLPRKLVGVKARATALRELIPASE